VAQVKPLVIGLCGRKRVGKDTVAEYLKKQFGFTQYAFADPLKEACKVCTALLTSRGNFVGTEAGSFGLPRSCFASRMLNFTVTRKIKTILGGEYRRGEFYSLLVPIC